MFGPSIRLAIFTTPEGEAAFRDVLLEFGGIDGRLLLYRNGDEIKDMAEQLQGEIDVFLFGGPLSYHLYRKYVSDSVPTVSIEYKETELLYGLLQLSADSGLPPKGLSLDTFEKKLVDEVLSEVNLPEMTTYVKPFAATESTEEIVRFHRELWETGRISHVLTCRRTVYEQLTALSIPATSVLPTKFNIRQSIAKAILLGENMRNTNFQIAIGHFWMSSESASPMSDYEREKLSLDFHRSLLDIAQSVNASLLPLGMFEFLMYTSRGFLQEVTRLWTESADFKEMEQKYGTPVYAGFGTGKTPMAAQAHAKSALERAREHREGCAFLIRDDGKIIGPLGSQASLEYSHRTTDPALQEVARNAGLSADTVGKLAAYARITGPFTAEELANVLGVTTRNIRNIMKKLADAGYLRETGLERPYPKGRPRKIYTFQPPN